MAEDNRTFGLRKDPIADTPELVGLGGDATVAVPSFNLEELCADVLGLVRDVNTDSIAD
jgi:hypothetical protein